MTKSYVVNETGWGPWRRERLRVIPHAALERIAQFSRTMSKAFEAAFSEYVFHQISDSLNKMFGGYTVGVDPATPGEDRTVVSLWETDPARL